MCMTTPFFQQQGTGGMSDDSFRFELQCTDGAARLGRIHLPRGVIRTPAFMPVGTQGTVKGIWPQDVRAAGADIILGNTYHLMLRPTAERIHELFGSLHAFMRWDGPILTDSGGFQVMSLSSLRKITEEGVHFRSHLDGSAHFMSPERSMEIQHLLDSDIRMQLDEVIALPATVEEQARAMQRSLRWAARCREAFERQQAMGRAIFGIVQGGVEEELRAASVKGLLEIGFHGYAIGGLAVGEGQETMLRMVEYTAALLPAKQPRYLMGVGTPEDLLEAVARGVDMFDCVMPTRAGRHGQAFTRFGKLNLRNARFATDTRPLDPGNPHPALGGYSRAYLHHLVKAGELLGQMILSLANIAYYQQLMAGMREAISQGTFEQFRQRTKEQWQAGLPD